MASFKTALIFHSPQEELTLKGYRDHLKSQEAAPPLTDAEHELKMIRENEVHFMRLQRLCGKQQ